MNKEEIIARITRDLQNDPKKRDALLAQWALSDGGRSSAALPAEQENSMAKVGLPHFFCYDNYASRPENTCGQAVIASLVDYFSKNPYGLARTYKGYDGNMHFQPNEILKHVYTDFGPNWPWKDGVTVRETILSALRTYGITCDEAFPAAYSNGSEAAQELREWIRKYRLPVVVLLDAGKPWLGGVSYCLHWCVVYAYDDQYVNISTWEQTLQPTWAEFMDAWHCWFVPYPNNFYHIVAWT